MKETISKMDKPASSFDSLSPESISSDKANINFLILEEFNRVNYLMTVGLASVNENRPRSHIARGVFFGLRSIESMMAHVLTPEYYEQAKVFKDKLTTPCGLRVNCGERLTNEQKAERIKRNPGCALFLYYTAPDTALNVCAEWYDLLVRQLPAIQLTATPKKPYDFK